MELVFIIAQVFGIIAWFLMAISYYRKNTTKIIFVQLLAIVFYCLNYLFLGAFAGIIIIIFEFVRDYLYYKSDKDDLIFLCSIPFYIVLAYFTRNNLIEIIPIVASLLEGFTLTKKKSVVVVGGVFAYILWIIYDLEVMSYTGAITDVIIVLSNVFIIIKYFIILKKVDNFRIYNHHILDEHSFKTIFALDKETYPKEFLWDVNYQKKLYEKNKDTFSIIKYKKKIIGYINYLVISKEEYLDIIKSNKVNIDYDSDDILKYSRNKDNYVIIDSIVIDEVYDVKKTTKLYDKAIKKYFGNIKKQGYTISNIIAIGTTDFEIRVLDNSFLKNKKSLKDKHILYSYREL